MSEAQQDFIQYKGRAIKSLGCLGVVAFKLLLEYLSKGLPIAKSNFFCKPHFVRTLQFLR